MLDLSVIFSTRNRAALLDQTLEGLARQDLGGLTWEIIVVDNGSTDETPQVLERHKSDLPLVALSEPAPGKNRALNRALDVSSGQLLVFTDDDIIPDRRWLTELHAAAGRWPNDALFGGNVIPRFPPATPAWLARREFPHAQEAFTWFEWPESEGVNQNHPAGPNMAIRRAVFNETRYCETIGPAGANYAMGSEAEILLRLGAAGYRYIYVPSATVEHVVRPEQVTLNWLKWRAFRSGRGLIRRDPALPDCPMLWSAPRFLWRRLFEQVLHTIASRLRGKEAYCLSLMDQYRTRGQIHEYCLLATERKIAGAAELRTV